MGKGRLVLDVYKDHRADPFFWVVLEGVSDPHKVYYGRESWDVDLNKKETRAKYAMDRYIQDAQGARVIGSIDISGPMDEIIRLIEFAGYHGCGGSAKPHNIYAPRKVLVEMMRHLPTLALQRTLRDDNDSCRKDRFHEPGLGIPDSVSPEKRAKMEGNRQPVDWTNSAYSRPLDRPTRYDQGAYAGEFLPIAGRHCVINVKPLDKTPKLTSNDNEPIAAIVLKSE